jgi:DNA-binding transcriptional ArsR family regulator
MERGKQFSSMASLIGEPARAIMLWNLLAGKAYTATELAISADISAQSASMHLAKLVKADLLTVESQGRHRYFRFSKPEVAYIIEAISSLVPNDKLIAGEDNDTVTSGIKYCRTCYDHLAGKVGVAITDRLLKQKIIVADKKEYEVTTKGMKWFGSLDISVNDLKKQKRVFARQCLDWSERRHHLSGALGASLLDKMLTADWIRRTKGSRSVTVTSKGQISIHKLLGLNV